MKGIPCCRLAPPVGGPYLNSLRFPSAFLSCPPLLVESRFRSSVVPHRLFFSPLSLLFLVFTYLVSSPLILPHHLSSCLVCSHPVVTLSTSLLLSSSLACRVPSCVLSSPPAAMRDSAAYPFVPLSPATSRRSERPRWDAGLASSSVAQAFVRPVLPGGGRGTLGSAENRALARPQVPRAP